jgi:hypothetical protein
MMKRYLKQRSYAEISPVRKLTLGSKARLLEFAGFTTDGYGSIISSLRLEVHAARAIAISKSTT